MLEVRRPLKLLTHLAVVTAAACTGSLTTGEGSKGDAAAPPVLPRLTATQWHNQIADVFGTEVPRPDLPADTNPYLFYSIGATSTELSEREAQQYADAAAEVAAWVVADPLRWRSAAGCAIDASDDECASRFVRSVGKRLFRRPLASGERERWEEIIADTSRGEISRGVRLALTGMLQSPFFLYRIELGEEDPEDPGRLRYTGYEMAQRLAFTLWNRGPDDALFEAAADGDLYTEEGIYLQAARMLDSEKARPAIQGFFAQYLGLKEIESLDRDPELYPQFTATLPWAMQTEIELMIDDIVFRRDADMRELFATRRTFVNSELAELYGIEAPGATEVAFAPAEHPADGPRAGILTTAALLSMNAHRTETSPTLRGKFVLERVLCQTVTPPPNDAELDVDDADAGPMTLRQRLEQHVSDPQCASCHMFIDPPGFLFEGFDSLGVVRSEDNGLPVDTSGDLDGVPLENARGLADILGSDERVANCVVEHFFRHAAGRLPAAEDAAAIEDLEREFEDLDYRFRDLLLTLVTSEAFRTVAAAETEAP